MREEASRLLRDLQYEMEAYRDERSDEWRESDRGESFDESLDGLGRIVDDLDALG